MSIQLPQEVIVRIIDTLRTTGTADDNWGATTILALSQTGRTFRSATDELVWRSWCFDRRVGRCKSLSLWEEETSLQVSDEDTWYQTALSLMNPANHSKSTVAGRGATLGHYDTCAAVEADPLYTFPLTATQIITQNISLRLAKLLSGACIPWSDPWSVASKSRVGVRQGQMYNDARPAVCSFTYATEPPCQGLVIRFDEYIPDLPGLEHLLIANSDGVTIADILNGIDEWMAMALTASQKAHLYALYTDTSLEAEVVDLLAEATEGVQGTVASSSNTLRRAKREAFLQAHEYRSDLATLPCDGFRSIAPGTLTLSARWKTHQSGDEWMPASEAPVF